MHALRRNLVRARDVLVESGYQFSETPMPGAHSEQALTHKLLDEHGLLMPGALRAFYEVIGTVEFSGVEPVAWRGCEYPDPLSIVPLDPQFWRAEVEHWRGLNEDELFTPQIAGDAIHKAGFSGGAYYIAFDDLDDPRFLGESLPKHFIPYLVLCNEWGFFAGLRLCADHSWPLEEIKRQFEPLPAIES